MPSSIGKWQGLGTIGWCVGWRDDGLKLLPTSRHNLLKQFVHSNCRPIRVGEEEVSMETTTLRKETGK